MGRETSPNSVTGGVINVFVIIVVVVAVAVLAYVESHQEDREFNKMVKRDREAQHRRGDIIKGGYFR